MSLNGHSKTLQNIFHNSSGQGEQQTGVGWKETPFLELSGQKTGSKGLHLTWGVLEELGLLAAEDTMLTFGFILLSLSSWYIRSRSESGKLRKFCIARKFTRRDWEAVLGSSSLRRISDNKPCFKKKKKPVMRDEFLWFLKICLV